MYQGADSSAALARIITLDNESMKLLSQYLRIAGNTNQFQRKL